MMAEKLRNSVINLEIIFKYFGLTYGFSLYFQGLYIYLTGSLAHSNMALRDPNLPHWLKLSDEFLMVIGGLCILLFSDKYKAIKFNKGFVFTIVASFYFILNLVLYKDVATDTLSLSVSKTLISFFIFNYFLVPHESNKYFQIFFKYVTVMIFYSQFSGIVLYYLINYSIYGNRLIGMTLNPNFNGIHAFFLVLTTFFPIFNSRMNIGVLATGALSIFLSCSMTSYAIVVSTLVVVGVLKIFYKSHIATKVFRNSTMFLIIFGGILAGAYFGKANILINDYKVKYYALTGRVATSTIVNGRLYGADKVIGEIFNGDPIVLLFGVTSGYLQTDSSWLNILYNFGLVGFLIVLSSVCSFFYLVYNFKSRPFNFEQYLLHLTANPLLVFAFCFLIFGSVLQQFLENWNVLIVLVMAFYFTDYFEKEGLVTENKTQT